MYDTGDVVTTGKWQEVRTIINPFGVVHLSPASNGDQLLCTQVPKHFGQHEKKNKHIIAKGEK